MTTVVTAENHDEQLRFSKRLELCLIDICRSLNVSPPIWGEKNTREFAHYHQTLFSDEQFMEKVPFSRLHIRWLDDGRE